MAIRGIVFDIGGVLEYTPRLGIDEKWEKIFKLQPGELMERPREVWLAGSIGTMTETEVYQQVAAIMLLTDEQVNAYMADVWEEYLGTLNTELTTYFASLRPQYQTATLSNSFVGARERECERYHLDEMCDFMIYSHEVGLQKPDPRIYALTCEKLDLQPNEVIFLDDRAGAIEAACAFGMHGILFEDNQQAITDIQACIAAQAE
jgi:epoxide hydrolase-like predicted phosphatase